MSAALLAFGGFLTRFAITQPAEGDGYAGTEYKWSRLVFRPAEYKYDVIALVVALAYLVWNLTGRSINRSKSSAWYAAVTPLLQQQFSLLKPTPNSSAPASALVKDGTAFLAYASGRKGIIGLHTTISLLPRPDPIALIWELLLRPIVDVTAAAPTDLVKLDLTLRPANSTIRVSQAGVDVQGESATEGRGLPTGTWAVLTKNGLNALRIARWDLSFPALVADNPKILSTDFAIMAEHSDITAQLLSPLSGGGSGLRELLDDAQSRRYLQSLVVSDLPIKRPSRSPTTPTPLHIQLTLSPPPPPAVSQAYLTVLLNISDLVTGNAPSPLAIRAEVARKLRTSRLEAWADVERSVAKKKEEAEREEGGGLTVKEKEIKTRKEAKRQGLSAEDKKKLDEREKKKSLKKQQMKQIKK